MIDKDIAALLGEVEGEDAIDATAEMACDLGFGGCPCDQVLRANLAQGSKREEEVDGFEEIGLALSIFAAEEVKARV